LRRVIAWCVVSCFYALRFSGGVATYLCRGNTSGNWLTTFLNTVVHIIMMKLCFMMCAEDNGVDPEVALKHFNAVLYSDDNVFASPYEWWTSQTYAHYMEKYFGAIVTATDKSDNFEDKHISEVSFLSRTFVPAEFNKEIILCPLAFESVISQLFYVRKGAGARMSHDFMYQQLQINLDNVVRELSQFPIAKARFVMKKIAEFIARNRLPLVLKDIDFNQIALQSVISQ
jgi:hypothetical protein